MSEFIDRTGYQPTAVEYADIEDAYYVFDGDKDAFCRAWCKANPHKAGRLTRAIKEEAKREKAERKCISLLMWYLRNGRDIEPRDIFNGCDLSVASHVVRRMRDWNGLTQDFTPIMWERYWKIFGRI